MYDIYLTWGEGLADMKKKKKNTGNTCVIRYGQLYISQGRYCPFVTASFGDKDTGWMY